ncbi:uncharacterized protein LOC128264888 isoform X1 [Drosophila gunungcola]|uniref:uncharacterized protein LOC128264888 isoform X1 n=1 Tax=Drosophila gunungcola TaxID=103775 RepID=UPI0022E39D95|nr:uncharacterized protein LOC128264888 isoform X1 [Drosophila gunungcola]
MAFQRSSWRIAWPPLVTHGTACASNLSTPVRFLAKGTRQLGKHTRALRKTEENSFGWILPRGAQLSHTATRKIQERQLNKRRGKSSTFLLEDGSKTWRVRLGRGFRVCITEHSPPAEEMNQSEEDQELTEVINHADNLRGTELISPLELAELMDEIELVLATEESIVRPIDIEQALQTEEMEQEVRAVELEQEVENSFGWIVPLGAELPETVILQIQNRLLKKPHGKRYRCRLDDESKTWNVTFGRGNRVRVRQYEWNVTEQAKNTDQNKNKAQYNPVVEELDLIEDMTQTDEKKMTEQMAQEVKAEQTEEIEQTEVAVKSEQAVIIPSDWIVPLGAELSETAILHIQNLLLKKAVGKRFRFTLDDSSKTWRVIIGSSNNVRIRPHIRLGKEKEQNKDTEQRKDGDPTKDEAQCNLAAEKMDKSEDISQTNEQMELIKQAEETVKSEQAVNIPSDWTVPLGAELSETAILQIQNRLLKKAHGKRCRFTLDDGSKAWRVSIGHSNHVGLRQKEQNKNTEKGKDKAQYNPGAEETNQAEQPNQAEALNQTDEIDESEQLTKIVKVDLKDEIALSVRNSFGWILPLGAKLSDATIAEIQGRVLIGEPRWFLHRDGSKTWRITVGPDHRIRIIEHTPPQTDVMNLSKEEQEQTEEINHQKDEAVKSVQIAQSEKEMEQTVATLGGGNRVSIEHYHRPVEEMEQNKDTDQTKKLWESTRRMM